MRNCVFVTLLLIPAVFAKTKSVERKAVRTATEDVGLQASRLNVTVRAVNSTGAGADCPKTAAQKLPETAVADAPVEPRYTDVMGENGRTFRVSVVPKSMLPKIYETMKTREYDKKSGANDAPMIWANNCLCKERAHFIGDKLARKLNLETGKLMVAPQVFNPLGRTIIAQLPNGQTPAWAHHVTNFVMVDEGDGKPPTPYALDPGLFPDAPVPVETWRQKGMKGIGDGGWADFALGKARVTMTNRYAFSPEDQQSYLDSYPDDRGANKRSLSKNNVRLYDNNGRGNCLGRI